MLGAPTVDMGTFLDGPWEGAHSGWMKGGV